MLNFFWKASLIIILINSAFFFLFDQQAFSNQFNWLPNTLSHTKIDLNSSSQTTPTTFGSDVNFNQVHIAQTGTSSSSDIPSFSQFLSSATALFNFGLNITFGFFIWMGYVFPCSYQGATCINPIVLIFGIPLAFIQIVGLFTLLQGIIGVMVFAIKSLFG